MKTIFTAFVLLGVLLLTTRSRSEKPQPTFSLAISLEQSTIKAGAEARLSIELTNRSMHDIYIPRACGTTGELSGYEVEAVDSHQQLAPRTKYGKAIHGEGEPIDITACMQGYVLQPNDIGKDAIVVNKLFEIDTPGKYIIQVRRLDNETKLYVRSNKVSLTVLR